MKLRKDKWKTDKIGNVCQVISGGTPSRNVPEYFGGEIAWFTPTEIPKEKIKLLNKSVECITELGLKKSSARILKKGTVLLTSRATIGLIAIAGKDVTTNQGFANFICNNLLHNWYLAFWLNFKVDFIKSLSTGTTFKEISKTTIRNLEIPLPPLEEQKQIAALFQTIETAIEQVEGQEKNLKRLQQKLSNNLVSITPSFGNLLTSKNCTLCTFGAIADCIEKHNKHPLESEITRFIGLEFIEADNFNLQGFGEIEKGTTFTKCFSKGDVLFGKRRAYLRKVAVADFDGICSGDILVLRANKSKMLLELLPYYVSSDAFINQAITTSAGSLSPRTKWRDLADLEIAVPDLKTQKIVVDVFQQLQQTQEQINQQKTTLKNLKQKLLIEILG